MKTAVVEQFYKMMRGEIPTVPRLDCTECGGTARIAASPWRNGRLAVSIKCRCIETQLDGVPKWPGWEALQSEPS